MFLDVDSSPFKIEATRIHRKVDINPSSHTYEHLVTLYKTHYRSLVAQNLWPEISTGTGKSEGEIVGLKVEIKKLSQAIGNSDKSSKVVKMKQIWAIIHLLEGSVLCV